MFHGRVKLARVGGYARAHAKPHATYRVHEDPASPTLVGGCAVACTVFYERGFGVPSHQFLRSLLQSYSLELHHLTPLGILHIAAFMTLCEAFVGIELHFNLSNYFFRAWLWPDLDVEAAVWGNVDPTKPPSVMSICAATPAIRSTP